MPGGGNLARGGTISINSMIGCCRSADGARGQATPHRVPVTPTSVPASEAQPRPKSDSIRWIVGVENAERTEGPEASQSGNLSAACA